MNLVRARFKNEFLSCCCSNNSSLVVVVDARQGGWPDKLGASLDILLVLGDMTVWRRGRELEEVREKFLRRRSLNICKAL